jgi:transposase-like protein
MPERDATEIARPLQTEGRFKCKRCGRRYNRIIAGFAAYVRANALDYCVSCLGDADVSLVELIEEVTDG